MDGPREYHTKVPRASPGSGRGDGAHREPLVKVGSAPGARQGRRSEEHTSELQSP